VGAPGFAENTPAQQVDHLVAQALGFFLKVSGQYHRLATQAHLPHQLPGGIEILLDSGE
jgi:hypothetical protein